MDNDVRPPERSRPPDEHRPEPRPRLETKQSTAPSEAFKTPDEVAAEQTLREASEATQRTDMREKPHSSRGWSGWKQKLALHWPPGKKEWIVAAVVIVLAGGGVWLITHHAKPVATVTKPAPKPKPAKPTTVPSTLSGLPVDPSVNQRPVTAVMVENSVPARPQAGLSQAMVVFEALAEGGVTRFVALYQDTSPGNVGPIRSARPYFEQWILGFDAGYAHVGGSPAGLADIKSWNVRDLDQFYNSGYYHRISSRPAPHNVYTSISDLNQLENKKGYTHSTFTGFPRKKEAPSKTPTAKTINLTLSGPAYNVHYDYDSATNSYNRSEGGAAQIDSNTNKQISPKVVIAMVIPEQNGPLDSTGAYYSDYSVIGSGPVYVFQDGIVTTGQWSKTSSTSQITFTDASSQPIKLNPGQTWLTAVTSSGHVGYEP